MRTPLPNFHNVLFTDLDDSLFSSGRKCRETTGLEPAAFLGDGSPCSYTTPAQRAFFEAARRDMIVVPTTARDADAYARVALPFSSYAILDHGGVVLHPGGTLDRHWLERTRDAANTARPHLDDLRRRVDTYLAHTALRAWVRIVEDFGVAFYVLVKDKSRDAATLAAIEGDVIRPWVADGRETYFVHHNDDNLAIMPATLDKEHAVRYVAGLLRAEHGDIITFGLGDSRSDARFVRACDYAIIPARTALSELTLGAL